MSVLDGLIDTYEMRTGNTTEAVREEIKKMRTAIREARIIIQKAAEECSVHDIQPPSNMTIWLDEYKEDE